MMNKISRMLLICTVLATSVLFSQQEAEAQLVLVTSKYRIVSVDRAEQRIGIALPDADPKVRQTWVTIDPDTVGSKRSYYGNGLFRDEKLTFNGILDLAATHRGQLIKIHGGRGFDGNITAKKVWF